MKRLTYTEYSRIPRERLGENLWQKLQAFDESHLKGRGQSVFDWSRRHCVRTKNWVGVIRIPGLEIEILPKTEDTKDQSVELDQESAGVPRMNLLYMLSITRNIPMRERELASLKTRRMPLWELLCSLFARRLFTELKKGTHHEYINCEENLSCVKGKILISEHIKANAAHQERMMCSYDEFDPDNLINRILKAACRVLVTTTRKTSTHKLLRQSLLILDDAEDCSIQDHHFNEIHLNRNTERFEELLIFARLVLTGHAPAPRTGPVRTFSLLFPMEKLFEEFIARFIYKHADSLELSRDSIHIQAKRHQRCLLRKENPDGARKFHLKPDLLIEPPGKKPVLVLDTKWKRLSESYSRQGVAREDLYQLFAYAKRYDSPDNVLLYPKVPTVSRETYFVDDESEKRVRIEFVDVSRDIKANKVELIKNLRNILVNSV